MESKATSKTKALMIVLAIFVIGFAAGALSMNLYQRTTASTSPWGKRDGRPQDYLVDKMTKKLELTSDQRERIRAILDDTFSRYGEIRKDIEPRIDAVRQDGRGKIRSLLTAEQLTKFQEMIDEQERERARWNQSHQK
jgi:Spy/CpxP family protein refolding chaperone